jgi:hypothetical protein
MGRIEKHQRERENVFVHALFVYVHVFMCVLAFLCFVCVSHVCKKQMATLRFLSKISSVHFPLNVHAVQSDSLLLLSSLQQLLKFLYSPALHHCQ